MFTVLYFFIIIYIILYNNCYIHLYMHKLNLYMFYLKNVDFDKKLAMSLGSCYTLNMMNIAMLRSYTLMVRLIKFS